MKNFLKKFSFLILVPSAFLLTSCNVGEAFNGVEKKLWPNIWILLAQILAFLIMALIVIIFAYKPIKKNLDARRDKVAKTVRDAEDNYEDAKLKNAEADANIKKSYKEGEDIIAKSIATAEEQKRKIIEEAENDANKRRKQAEKDIENEKIKMEQEIHNEIVTGALEASKQILQRELSEEDNKKIIEDFLNKADKKGK